MRKYSVALAILALPGLALGQRLDVGVDGVPGGSIVAGSDPITIDVFLTSPIGLSGAQYCLTAELLIGGVPQGPGSGDNMVTYDDDTPWINGTVFAGLGGDYVQLIGAGVGDGQTMAAMNMMGPELYSKLSGETPPWGLLP